MDKISVWGQAKEARLKMMHDQKYISATTETAIVVIIFLYHNLLFADQWGL